MERVTRGRVARLEPLPFIGVNIPSEFDRSTQTSSILVSAFKGRHEVFRGTQAWNQISGVHERKEVDVLLTGRVKAGNSSNLSIEVVVSDMSRSSLVNRGQLDKDDGGTWCDGVVRLRSGRFSESIVVLELDHKVLCSMWSAPISFVPKWSGNS